MRSDQSDYAQEIAFHQKTQTGSLPTVVHAHSIDFLLRHELRSACLHRRRRQKFPLKVSVQIMLFALFNIHLGIEISLKHAQFVEPGTSRSTGLMYWHIRSLFDLSYFSNRNRRVITFRNGERQLWEHCGNETLQIIHKSIIASVWLGRLPSQCFSKTLTKRDAHWVLSPHPH